MAKRKMKAEKKPDLSEEIKNHPLDLSNHTVDDIVERLLNATPKETDDKEKGSKKTGIV